MSVAGSAVKLSLIVSVLESYEVVRRQLLHLSRLLTPECELILVDDGSEPSLAPFALWWCSTELPTPPSRQLPFLLRE